MISTLRNHMLILCFGLLFSGATVTATDTAPIAATALDLVNAGHECAKTYLEAACPTWRTDLDEAIAKIIELHMAALHGIDDTFITQFEEFCTTFNLAEYESYAHLAKTLYPSEIPYAKEARNYMNIISVKIAAYKARQEFKNASFSPAAYIAAWDALWNADSITAGLKTVWNDHRAVLVGTTVVVATAAAVTTAIIYRNKIKASFNKLFGKTEQTEEAQTA